MYSCTSKPLSLKCFSTPRMKAEVIYNELYFYECQQNNAIQIPSSFHHPDQLNSEMHKSKIFKYRHYKPKFQSVSEMLPEIVPRQIKNWWYARWSRRGHRARFFNFMLVSMETFYRLRSTWQLMRGLAGVVWVRPEVAVMSKNDISTKPFVGILHVCTIDACVTDISPVKQPPTRFTLHSTKLWNSCLNRQYILMRPRFTVLVRPNLGLKTKAWACLRNLEVSRALERFIVFLYGCAMLL